MNGSLHEADINLDEALYLRNLWRRRGATVSMTRETDATMSTRERYEYCNSRHADILVSVHTNSVADPAVDGTLAYYFHNDDKMLASALYGAMLSSLGPTAPDPLAFREFDVLRGAYGVLLKSKMPAAIVEPVFMSHPGEAALLQTAIGNGGCRVCRRQQIADAIAAGVDDYLLALTSPSVISLRSPRPLR